MKTVKNNGHRIFEPIGGIMIALLFIMLLAGCSKGDDGVDELDMVNTVNGTDGVDGMDGGSSDEENSNAGLGGTVTIKEMVPASPANLHFGDSIAITYDYDIERAGGVRIWIQPFTNGDLSQANSFSPSPVFKGKGTETVHIVIAEGDPIVVDQLKTQINTPGIILLGVLLSSNLISESFESVDYTFTN